MLLDQVLNQDPGTAALLLRRLPYAEGGQSALVRDVLALANAAAGDVRHVLFGAERAGGRVHICGLDQTAIERFRDLCHDVGELIEPRLRVAQLFAEVEHKTIAALEIRGCDNPPYTLRRRIDENMRTGACWVRDAEDIRPARREDLERIYASRAVAPPAPVLVGCNGDPLCLQLLLDVPDSSRPPSQCAREKLLSAIDAKKTTKRLLGNEPTGMERLAHARIFGPEAPYQSRGIDTLIEHYDQANDAYSDADRHYFYEQQAVRLEFSVRNQLPAVLEQAAIEFSFPRIPGFEVADRLYSDPEGNQTLMESRLAGYPDVQNYPERSSVLAEIERLQPDIAAPIFETPLRLRVGAEMRGMKVAVRYRLAAPSLKEPVNGKLKLVFHR